MWYGPANLGTHTLPEVFGSQGKAKELSASLLPSIPVDRTCIFCCCYWGCRAKAHSRCSHLLRPDYLPGSRLALSASFPVSVPCYQTAYNPRANSRDMTTRVTAVSFMAHYGKTIDVVAPEPPEHSHPSALCRQGFYWQPESDPLLVGCTVHGCRLNCTLPTSYAEAQSPKGPALEGGACRG